MVSSKKKLKKTPEKSVGKDTERVTFIFYGENIKIFREALKIGKKKKLFKSKTNLLREIYRKGIIPYIERVVEERDLSELLTQDNPLLYPDGRKYKKSEYFTLEGFDAKRHGALLNACKEQGADSNLLLENICQLGMAYYKIKGKKLGGAREQGVQELLAKYPALGFVLGHK